MEDVFNLEIVSRDLQHQNESTTHSTTNYELNWIYSFDVPILIDANNAKYMNIVCAAKIDLQGNGLRPLNIANSKISVAQIPSAHLGFNPTTMAWKWRPSSKDDGNLSFHYTSTAMVHGGYSGE